MILGNILKKTKINKFWLIFLTIMSILLTLSSCYKNEVNIYKPLAKKGVLDLTKWDINKNKIIKLDGEWEFYWNKFLNSDDFTNNNVN